MPGNSFFFGGSLSSTTRQDPDKRPPPKETRLGVIRQLGALRGRDSEET